MLKAVYIRRFLAGFLLVIFAFSITPKRILHDIFAKHIDHAHSKLNDKGSYQFTNTGYNCDNDNLVAESNFIYSQQGFSFPLFNSFASYAERDISFLSVTAIFSSLRGPPATV